jgi:hypothetical protein
VATFNAVHFTALDAALYPFADSDELGAQG